MCDIICSINSNKLSHKESLAINAQAFVVQAYHGLFGSAKTNQSSLAHLQEVVNLVRASGGSDAEIAAAWLHSSLKDTSTTVDEISKKFGVEVAKIVQGLTMLLGPDTSLEENLTEQTKRTYSGSVGIRRVKIADQTSTMRLLVNEPSNTMNRIDRRKYIKRAKSIAQECIGISPLLDGLFIEACREATSPSRRF